ncbi:citrinin biosynthesis oxidoreductase CtnB [Colletotrichum truncatum]|uniref:Citrinin biosynthesis oxidoreductase CtnB n=1 Tax=Colletotrichum truncatum TaxID=5467 RepID=A0ACC3YFR1_COLTU|nr:citrinin biosynthesis oxidoreductase CtnB [Colletotrichum truncatum]KAF6788378.1 citrinin biosynthesis oxidoreductase CtnB [Colletotrichum truncatum]
MDKPKVLCLHGAGSSGAIFKVQLRRFTKALSAQFDFVFANAPFECGIGPGMHPTFASSGPFYRWQCEESNSEHLGLTEEDINRERQIVKDYIGNLLKKSSNAPFVGVIGFSQGCGIATGLLLDQHELGRCWGYCPIFQFAWLICATYPPLTLLTSQERDSSVPTETISIASLHVIGTKDPYKGQSKKMYDSCWKGPKAKCIEFEGSHHVPTALKDVDSMLRALSNITQGVLIM